MSRYGAIPTTSSTPPPPESSSSPPALDSSTTIADDAPGDKPPLAALRPWRELADPHALSIPRDLTDAYHRASASITRCAANYELVLVAVLSTSLLGRHVVYQLLVLCSLLVWRRKSFPVLFTFNTLVLLWIVGASAVVVLVSLPVALLVVVTHAALHHSPAADIEEAGLGDKPVMSSKYGTFPATASSSTAPLPDGSSTSSAASIAGDDAPWGELADPRALSIPRGFSDARRRARANLARFAANYGQVYFLVYTACLLWWGPMYLFLVVACFSVSAGRMFRFLLAFTPFLLVVTGAATGVLALLAVGLLLIAAHAVLHLPTDGVGVDEEVGVLCDEPQQPLVVS